MTDNDFDWGGHSMTHTQPAMEHDQGATTAIPQPTYGEWGDTCMYGQTLDWPVGEDDCNDC